MHAREMHYWVLEATVLILALVAAGDPTHFTWWGVGILLAGLASIGVLGGRDPYVRRVIVTAVVSSTLILTAVVIMSLMKCGMLNETYDDLGPWVYTFGNFALHYYPALRALHWAGQYLWMQPFTPRKNWITKLGGLHGDAALIISTYCILVEPAHVYGCTVHSPGLLSIVGSLSSLALEAVILLLETPRGYTQSQYARHMLN